MDRASVGILTTENRDKFLLLLRPKDDETIRDKWTFVAGTIDEGETPLETIKREVEEELQFDSTSIKFTPIGESKRKNLHLFYFVGIMKDEEVPILNNENVDWGWFRMDKLPKKTFNEAKKILIKLFGDE
jgi:8-oxo-dGTP pyrophosphatase MutT (NUDIX family)